MIEIIPKKELTAFDIKYLREISGKSISQIKSASLNGECICCFEAFENNWQDDRVILSSISKLYSQKTDAPFYVKLCEYDEYLSPSQLHELLLDLRSQELAEQKSSDLENGFISNYEDFEPHDEDWI
ncbi:hypothetical protein F9817_23290 [Vibrio sp. CAIM 722]|uniref:Uncharacterized protein n=1 Tax=Vibrio eleionomae TaxID=2653505 RepID=A0A7X4RX48_9VIBR|nr:hypothetical protein [Vibrio eleionomae]MZI96112.1 hypothetical protein [Vibrio eleionomae]